MEKVERCTLCPSPALGHKSRSWSSRSWLPPVLQGRCDGSSEKGVKTHTPLYESQLGRKAALPSLDALNARLGSQALHHLLCSHPSRPKTQFTGESRHTEKANSIWVGGELTVEDQAGKTGVEEGWVNSHRNKVTWRPREER